MAIYYTCVERGIVRKFPEKITEKKVLEELEKNWQKLGESKSGCSFINNRIIHSVFFVRGRKVIRIWDSNIKGFREMKDEIILHESIE